MPKDTYLYFIPRQNAAEEGLTSEQIASLVSVPYGLAAFERGVPYALALRFVHEFQMAALVAGVPQGQAVNFTSLQQILDYFNNSHQLEPLYQAFAALTRYSAMQNIFHNVPENRLTAYRELIDGIQQIVTARAQQEGSSGESVVTPTDVPSAMPTTAPSAVPTAMFIDVDEDHQQGLGAAGAILPAFAGEEGLHK